MDHLQRTEDNQWKGRALEPLPANSITLRIFCPELTPMHATGAFSPGINTGSFSTKDASGVSTTTSATTANYIQAEWRSRSNQAYPPSVQKGEQVVVYQVGNVDKFYWDAEGRDRSLRRLERHRDEVSATPNGNEEKTDDNTYFSEKNSAEGTFTIAKTSKANGEPVRVVIVIDAKNGLLTITDDKQDSNTKSPANSVVVDFVNDTIQLTTHQKATVSLVKQDIFMYAPRDIIAHAERQILLDSPLITFNRQQAGLIVFNAANMAFNAATDFIVTAARAGFNAVVKCSQQIVTGTMRAVSYATGPVQEAYKPSTSDLDKGSATVVSNSSDTDTAGASNRFNAAWEDTQEAFEATAAAIQIVAKAAKTDVDTSGITDNAATAKMPDSKGA